MKRDRKIGTDRQTDRQTEREGERENETYCYSLGEE